MRTVTKRELNQQTASVLAAVDAGESVVVTERGEPRWTIELVTDDQDALARMRRLGRLHRAKPEPAAWPVFEDTTYTPAEVDRLFEESRGER